MSARKIRHIVLEQSKRAHVGHIGSGLCVAEILAVLYGEVLKIASPSDPDRDRFVLSKGHAALALYAALFLRGWLTQAQLDSFCGDGSLLGVHPEHALEGVDFSTGSLGQGISMGVGAALAAKKQRSERRVYVLVSDAECNEGSLWEAVMFAAHHKLDNLVVVIDANAQQALGFTKDVIDLAPLSERWKAFGWDVTEVDGHDTSALQSALDPQRKSCGRPRAIVAHTVFGKGVSFMEGKIKWHYWPMSEDEFTQAVSEVGESK